MDMDGAGASGFGFLPRVLRHWRREWSFYCWHTEPLEGDRKEERAGHLPGEKISEEAPSGSGWPCMTCLEHYRCVSQCFMGMTQLLHADIEVFSFPASVTQQSHFCCKHSHNKHPNVLCDMSPVQLMSEALLRARSIHFSRSHRDCDKDNLLHHTHTHTLYIYIFIYLFIFIQLLIKSLLRCAHFYYLHHKLIVISHNCGIIHLFYYTKLKNTL